MKLAVEYGPLVGIIGLLFRSNAKKDDIIERMATQLLEANTAQKEVAAATRKTVEAVQHIIGGTEG